MEMFLQGEWVSGNQRVEVVNPYNGASIDTVPVGSAKDIESALDGLEQGAKVMRDMPPISGKTYCVRPRK